MKNFNKILILAIITVFCLSFGFTALAEENAENVVVIGGRPVALPDPALATDWFDQHVVYNLYDPLVYPAPGGTIKSHLAVNWHPVDDQVDHWRFELRKGVKFHDGSEMTAEDVAFSMERLKTINQGRSGIFGAVEPEVVSKYVVDFKLGRTFSVFPQTLVLFWVLDKEEVMEHTKSGQYGEYGDYGLDWLKTHDAGTGPYKMVSREPGVKTEAVRFDDYFLGWNNSSSSKAPIERIVFQMSEDPSSMLLNTKKGQMDIIAEALSQTKYKEVEKSDKIRAFKTFATSYTAWMNTKKPPTDDIHFRKAIQYAFDYQAIFDKYNSGRPAGAIMSSLEGYKELPPIPRKQDLDTARKELELSKYDPGKVVVKYDYTAGLDRERVMGLQLQASMSTLGVKVEVNGPPWPQLSSSCGSPDTTPNLVMMKFPVLYPSPDFSLSYKYHPDNVGGIFGAHWYESEELRNLIDKSRTVVDKGQRIKVYEEVQEIIGEKALALYAAELPQLFTAQKYLIDMNEGTYSFPGPDLNMYKWRINLEQKEELRG